MAVVETKHTLAAIEKIKKEISTFMKLVRTISMAFFSVYYIYLIYSNIASIPHVIAYVILFGVVITSFVVEQSLKATTDDTRKNKRQKVEKRRKIGIITKALKYLAKCITVGFALYATLSNAEHTEWDLIMDVVSCVILAISVLAEFVTSIINRYIDYLKIGFGMDYEESSIVTNFMKFFGGKQAKANASETELLNLQQESRYTLQEENIRQMLKDEAQRMAEERNERLSRRIEANELLIARLKGKKLSKKQKSAIENKYAKLCDESLIVMDEPKKLARQLEFAQELISDLSAEENVDLVQDFLILVSSYITEQFVDISRQAIADAVAVLTYFIDTVRDTPEHLANIEHVDTVFVASLWFKKYKKEWKKFVAWQKKNKQQLGD